MIVVEREEFFDLEHNKEVFFEEKKLEQVLNILEIETLNYITKRKYITEYILEARKKYIEEYKDDEVSTCMDSTARKLPVRLSGSF